MKNNTEARPLTKLEQLEWLEETLKKELKELEQEIEKCRDELDECEEEIEKMKIYVKED